MPFYVSALDEYDNNSVYIQSGPSEQLSQYRELLPEYFSIRSIDGNGILNINSEDLPSYLLRFHARNSNQNSEMISNFPQNYPPNFTPEVPPNYPPNYPKVLNSKSEKLNSGIYFFEPDPGIRNGRIQSFDMSGKLRKTNPARGEKLDMELIINDPEGDESNTRLIVLKDLLFEENLTLGIDELPHDKYYISYRKGIVNAFAINLDGLNFTEGIFTSVAQGSELYKCAEWNFTTQQCLGSWIRVQGISPGHEYNISLFPGDPGYIEVFDLNQSVDLEVAALNHTTIVIAWIDSEAGNHASFEVWNTNGSIITNEVDLDTTGDTSSRIAVEPINKTHFIIAIDDGPVDSLVFRIYNVTGSLLVGPTTADNAIGNINDVAICQLRDRFVLANANSADSDADYRIYNNTGVSVVAESNVDGTITPEALGQNMVDCAVVNSSYWVYNWFDDGTNDASIASRSNTGATLAAELDVDADVGETGQVAIAGMRQNHFAVAFYDSTDDDITITVRRMLTAAFTTALANTDIDLDAGTDSRLSVAEIENSGESNFAVVWEDAASTDIKAAVYNRTGSQVTAPFTVTTTQHQSYPLLDVVGYNSHLGQGLCNYTFVVVYTNLSGNSVFEKFWVNGSKWDGRCPEYISPNVTLVYPPNGTINRTRNLVQLQYNVTDDSHVANCSLYINDVLNMTNTSIVRATTLNFTINLSNGNYNWSVGCTDEFGNKANSTKFNISISSFFPYIYNITATQNIVLKAGSTRLVYCNFSVNEGNGISDLYSANATLALYNSSLRSDDNNTKYTNASCSVLASSGNNSNYSCSFGLYYYASNGTWNCTARVSDIGINSGENFTETLVDTLYALNVSQAAIFYGDISSGMYSNDTEMNITNFGNQDINISIKAYGGDNPVLGEGLAMNCVDMQNITVSNHRFALQQSTPFASKIQLSSSNQDMGVTVRKQTDPGALSLNSTYLQLYVPPMQITSCNGTVVYMVAIP